MANVSLGHYNASRATANIQYTNNIANVYVGNSTLPSVRTFNVQGGGDLKLTQLVGDIISLGGLDKAVLFTDLKKLGDGLPDDDDVLCSCFADTQEEDGEGSDRAITSEQDRFHCLVFAKRLALNVDNKSNLVLRDEASEALKLIRKKLRGLSRREMYEYVIENVTCYCNTALTFAEKVEKFILKGKKRESIKRVTIDDELVKKVLKEVKKMSFKQVVDYVALNDMPKKYNGVGISLHQIVTHKLKWASQEKLPKYIYTRPALKGILVPYKCETLLTMSEMAEWKAAVLKRRERSIGDDGNRRRWFFTTVEEQAFTSFLAANGGSEKVPLVACWQSQVIKQSRVLLLAGFEESTIKDKLRNVINRAYAERKRLSVLKESERILSSGSEDESEEELPPSKKRKKVKGQKAAAYKKKAIGAADVVVAASGDPIFRAERRVVNKEDSDEEDSYEGVGEEDDSDIEDEDSGYSVNENSDEEVVHDDDSSSYSSSSEEDADDDNLENDST